MWQNTRLGIAFYKYHEDNPNVYELFKQFTFYMIDAGWNRYSAHAIIQRVRWESDIKTISTDGLKISNNHFPYYARLFMEDYPDHDGFFVIHNLKDEVDEPGEPDVLFDVGLTRKGYFR